MGKARTMLMRNTIVYHRGTADSSEVIVAVRSEPLKYYC